MLARELDAEARELRKWHEDEVEAVVEAAHEDIARARFEMLGTSVYPDATFTLRLNFGSVQGWVENGTPVEPFTQARPLVRARDGSTAVRRSRELASGAPTLDLATPFNLSTNNDIVGGNSGSPLIDADGRIVGLVFDGNIHSISGAYWFDAAKNRTVAVHPAIIREALTKVYRVGVAARRSSARGLKPALVLLDERLHDGVLEVRQERSTRRLREHDADEVLLRIDPEVRAVRRRSSRMSRRRARCPCAAASVTTRTPSP